MLRQILASSRYMIIIAVIGSFLSAIGVLVDGGLTAVNILVTTFSHAVFTPEEAKHLAVESIEVIDLFLLGTVLYIVALGLYELFIDESLPMPKWLAIANLDDLKARLLGVVIVLLAVTFLGYVVEWDGKVNIAALGIAVGLVVLALGYLMSITNKAHQSRSSENNKEE
jgi:uncharacterized membrane protein YqhA